MQSLITEIEAAKLLNISVATLQRDRCVNGELPRFPYVKIGRTVRYDPEHLSRAVDAARVGGVPEE